ncbi:unnamed protein product [Bursaphelenchus xylophilus]|uniref:(pine wood nematode) hypothetical protein n=1 Tax=Bursaphelenchus xylophilus TaxID=6326 RepID=A0A1I7SQZ9_BURXY|nr:unnamed protein product [Bursaphelenchus xylophilus]CAG9110629.1 unnamed protein product [Bursaphelenchus xylophilus]
MSARIRSGDAGALSEADFEEAFEKIPHMVPLIPRDLDKRFQAIAKSLNNEAANWMTTCASLVEIRSIVKFGELDGKTIASRMLSIQDEIRQAVSSLRSQVARDACMTVAYVAAQIGHEFKSQSEGLLPDLLRLSGQSTKIMATSGIIALKYICKYIRNPTFLQMLFEELKSSKNKLIRATISQMLYTIVEEWPEDTLQKNVQLLFQALEKGSVDADPTARKFSREAIQMAEAKISGFSAMSSARAIPTARTRTAQSTYIPMRAKSDMTSHKLRQPMSAASARILANQRKPSNPLPTGGNIPTKSQPSSRNASPKRQRPTPTQTPIQTSSSSSAIRSRVLNERRINGNGGSAVVPPRPVNGDMKGRQQPFRQVSEPKIHHVRQMRSPSPTKVANGNSEGGRRTPSNLRQPSAIITPSKNTTPVYRPQQRTVTQLTSQMSSMSVSDRNGTEDVHGLLMKTQPRTDGSLLSNPEAREALDQLARLVGDNKVIQMDYYFPQMFSRALDLACNPDVENLVRCAAVRLVKALVKQSKGISQRINTLITEILNLEENELQLHKEVEDLYVEISNSIPSHVILPTLLNLVKQTKPTDPTKKVCAKLKLLPYVLHKTDPDSVESMVDEVVPVLCQIYESSNASTVRRDCVICLIVFKNKVGMERLNQILNTTLEKLVDAYSKRHNMAVWK